MKKEPINKNFNHILTSEVLQVIHKAINVAYSEYGKTYPEGFDKDIDRLKNTVNSFIDGELEVYKNLVRNQNYSQ